MTLNTKKTLVPLIGIILASLSASSFAAVTGTVTYLNFSATTGTLTTTVAGSTCTLTESARRDNHLHVGKFSS